MFDTKSEALPPSTAAAQGEVEDTIQAELRLEIHGNQRLEGYEGMLS
jgi:hypothetical protein